jgi:hypothetical protein
MSDRGKPHSSPPIPRHSLTVRKVDDVPRRLERPMVVVTLMTPAPDEETQRMVDEVRVPTGKTILSQSH